MTRVQQEGGLVRQIGRIYGNGFRTLNEMSKLSSSYRCTRRDGIDATIVGGTLVTGIASLSASTIAIVEHINHERLLQVAISPHRLSVIANEGIIDLPLKQATGEIITFSYDATYRHEQQYAYAGSLKTDVQTGKDGVIRIASEQIAPSNLSGWLVDTTDPTNGNIMSFHPVTGVRQYPTSEEIYQVYLAIGTSLQTETQSENLRARVYQIVRISDAVDGLQGGFIGTERYNCLHMSNYVVYLNLNYSA